MVDPFLATHHLTHLACSSTPRPARRFRRHFRGHRTGVLGEVWRWCAWLEGDVRHQGSGVGRLVYLWVSAPNSERTRKTNLTTFRLWRNSSKLDPVPHSLIRFKPYETFRVEDAAYDVEVEMELVRSQAASEMGEHRRQGRKVRLETDYDRRFLGNFMVTLDFLTDKTNEVVRSVSQPVSRHPPSRTVMSKLKA